MRAEFLVFNQRHEYEIQEFIQRDDENASAFYHRVVAEYETAINRGFECSPIDWEC